MKNKKGFTLVELVIVIAVIGVLAAVLVPTFVGILERTRESTRVQQITSARDELLSTKFDSITEIEGYIFVVEESVYKIENGKITNITDLVDIEEIEDTYTPSIVQSSNSSITIYHPTEVEAQKTYIDFSIDEENKTANVIGYNGNAPSNLVIPAYIQGVYGREIIEKEFSDFSDLERYMMDVEMYFYENPNSDKVYKLHYGDNKIKVYDKNSYSIWDDYEELSAYSNYILEEEVVIYCTGEENYKVVSIQWAAFSGCTNLTQISIPNSMEKIESYAFSGCSALSGKIILPNSLKEIGANVFLNTQIEFNTYNNCNYLPSDTNPYFIFYNVTDNSLTSIDIHNETKLIAGRAFNNSKITNITIPNSVISFGREAFYDCTELTQITIPDSVTNIGNSAFWGCTNLVEISIPNSVSIIEGYTFNNCTSLTKIIIPNSVISIEERAFYNCTSLTQVTIPSSIISIGDSAFYNCTGLTQVTIPDSVTSIESYTFSGCTGLTHVIISSNVTSIGDSAFSGCTGLTQITIPNSVTSIRGSFYNCTNLANVYYDGTIEDWCKIEFTNNTYLFTYATNVYMLDSNGNYYSLIDIEIPSSITNIGKFTFSDFKVLKSVIIQNGIVSIGDYAFYKCTNLTQIIIPNSVTTISDCAFYYCTSLLEITLSNNVTSIGNQVFYNCTSLDTVYYNGTIEDWCKIEFTGRTYLLNYASNIYMLDDNKEYYNVNNIEQIEIPNTITSIGDYKFEYFKTLESIIIPNSVTSIGYCSFYNCTNLKEIIIPNSTTSIGNWAFSGCTSLTEITMPNNVTSIGYYAFYNCTSLTQITIPSTVTSIGNNAFNGCTSLTQITIPNSVTTIDSRAFYKCSNLKTITFKHTLDDKLTIASDAFKLTSTTTTTINVVETSNINSDILNYNWSGSYRTVTYKKIED